MTRRKGLVSDQERGSSEGRPGREGLVMGDQERGSGDGRPGERVW